MHGNCILMATHFPAFASRPDKVHCALLQFVVEADAAGHSSSILGNDFEFNGYGEKTLSWQLDDKVVSQVPQPPSSVMRAEAHCKSSPGSLSH